VRRGCLKFEVWELENINRESRVVGGRIPTNIGRLGFFWTPPPLAFSVHVPTLIGHEQGQQTL
jgi:hypothetical protein